MAAAECGNVPTNETRMSEATLRRSQTETNSLQAKGHPLEPNNRNPILVVEDVYEIALQMRRVLIQRGHDVIFASTAEEAVQIAGEKSPAMILTDLELPTFDALVRMVNEHKSLNGLPIAIIDINDPHVPDQRVKVLPDFEAVDKLFHSLSSSPTGK